MGKSKLNEEEVEELIKLIIGGETLIKACEKLDIHTMQFWRQRQRDPLIEKRVADARIEASHLAVDQLRTITDDCVSMTDAAIARVKSDNIKWEAAKRVPQVYGDQLNLNVTQTLDIGPALLAARNRVLPMLDLAKVANDVNQRDVKEIETPATGETPVEDGLDDLL